MEDYQEKKKAVMNGDQSAELAKRAVLEFDRMANSVLAPYDLTAAQYRVILYIYRHENEKIRQTDLERYFSLSRAAMSALLDGLEKKGLIIRKKHPEDGRSRLIVLSGKAEEEKAALLQEEEKLDDWFDRTLTGRERKTLNRLLRKITMTDRSSRKD